MTLRVSKWYKNYTSRVEKARSLPPWESASRPQNGVTDEGVAVDADGKVYVAEGPASLADAGSAFTKYEVAP